MGTLLKAKLLKTNDPFIMLKCYLEDILKQDGKSWRELLQSMQRTNQPKMSNQLFTAIENLLDSETDMNKLGSPKSLLLGIKEGKQSNDPYFASVRESNVRALLNAIKGSEIEPTIMKPIMTGLQDLLSDIMDSQKTPKQKVTQGAGKGATFSRVKEDKQLERGIDKLTELRDALQDAKLDFDGDFIHDDRFERNLSEIVKNKYDVAELRETASPIYAEKTARMPQSDIKKLRQKVYNLLNEPIEFNHHTKGRIKEPFIDALLYAYSQNTGVTLADIKQQRDILNARNDIWYMVTTRGRDVLMDLATAEDAAMRRAIEERETERPSRQEEGLTFEEREAQAERERQELEDLMAGKTIRRN